MATTQQRIPRGLPFLGHLFAFDRDPLGFCTKTHARYGATVRLRIGRPTLLISDPQDVRHVLVTNPSHYSKTPRLTGQSARSALGGGLMTQASGQGHLAKRRTLQPLFHQRVVAQFTETIHRCTRETLDRWQPSTEIDLTFEFKQLAQRVMITTLFGEMTPTELQQIASAVSQRRAYYEQMISSLLPNPILLPTRTARRYRTTRVQLERVIASKIEQRRRLPTDDLLSGLLAAGGDDGSCMGDAEVRDEALTFIDTGYETIAAALTWTTLLLATNPEPRALLLTELDSVLGGDEPKAEDLQRLPYLGLIINESLRLYPPTWMFVRIATQDDQLPSGTSVEAGLKLYLCPYLAHRNPMHFPEPDRFLPERFAAGAEPSRPALAHFPFGSGAHKCIGETFARLEATLVLASIFQDLEIELLTDQPFRAKAGLALRPKGAIRARVRPRNRPTATSESSVKST